MSERYKNEVYGAASEAMSGLFKVYLYSHDGELRAKCREMMDYFWAWHDKQPAESLTSDSHRGENI